MWVPLLGHGLACAWTNAMIHAAMLDHSARVLQRAVRRSGLLDHGFVLV